MKLIVLTLLFTTFSYARWATEQDLTYKTVHFDSRFEIKADGTYTQTDEVTYEILNVAAKEKFSLHKLPYRSNSSTLKVLEVKVVNGNTIIDVPLDKIADRSIAKDNGIDDTREVQIPIPQLQVKSRIILKYQTSYQKVVVPNHFSIGLVLGLDGLDESGVITFNSELPLNSKIQDPYKVFDIEEKNENNKFILTLTLKTPHLHQIVEEQSVLPEDKITFFQISSDKDWTSIGMNAKGRFDPVITSELPPELLPVIEEAKKLKTNAEKVNHLVAYITQNFNYVGDWRTLNGGFSPRKLSEILSTKYGDCKDFSSVLTAMLRKINIQADIALVQRSPSAFNRYSTPQVPSMSYFNHAIVRVLIEGKSYWIDPTNSVSFGLKHRDDIADRWSLVLDGKNELSKIPSIPAEQNQIIVEKDVQYDSDISQVSGKVIMTGLFGLSMTGFEKRESRDKAQQAFLALLGQGEEATLPEFSDFDLKDTRYKDIEVSLNYSTSDIAEDDGDKKYLKLPNLYQYVYSFFHNFTQWEGDLPLGESFKVERNYTFDGVYVNERPAGCKIDSQWVTVNRDFEYSKKGFKVKDLVVYKKNFINKADYKTTEMDMLQYKLRECLSERSVEINQKFRKHIAGFEEVEASFANLPVKERVKKRLQYAKSVIEKEKEGLKTYELWKLLKRNIEDDPKSMETYYVWAWDVLMHGYYNGSNYSPQSLRESKNIISQGLKVDPKHLGLSLVDLRISQLSGDKDKAQRDLSLVLTYGKVEKIEHTILLSSIYGDAGLRDKSIAIIQEALTIAKSKKEKEKIHFKLATLYSSNREPKKSLYHYLQVLKYDPEDAFTFTNLPSVLTRLGKYDEAVQIALKGLKINKAGMMSLVAANTLVSRANLHIKNKKFDLAEADLKRSLHIRKSAETYVSLAKLSYARGKTDRAVALIVEGAKSSEKDLATYYINSSYIFGNNIEPMSQIMKKAFDTSENPQMKLWTGKRLAYYYQTLKKTDLMENILIQNIGLGENLIKQNAVDVEVLANLGASLSMLGIHKKDNEMIQKGVSYLKQGETMDPSHQSIKYHIGLSMDALNGPSKNRIPASVLEEKIKDLKPGQIIRLEDLAN